MSGCNICQPPSLAINFHCYRIRFPSFLVFKNGTLVFEKKFCLKLKTEGNSNSMTDHQAQPANKLNFACL